MMTIRHLRAGEMERLVDECWLPFREEMATVDEYNALENENVRESGIAYRRRVFRTSNRQTFVSVRDESLQGYLSIGIMDPPPGIARGSEGVIFELYVRPEVRGEGIATNLRVRAEQWARERDCTHMALFVHPDNEPARSIYRSWGFDTKREMLVRPLNDT